MWGLNNKPVESTTEAIKYIHSNPKTRTIAKALTAGKDDVEAFEYLYDLVEQNLFQKHIKTYSGKILRLLKKEQKKHINTVIKNKKPFVKDTLGWIQVEWNIKNIRFSFNYNKGIDGLLLYITTDDEEITHKKRHEIVQTLENRFPEIKKIQFSLFSKK